MPMQNADVDVADILKKTADLLDIEGANPFRVRAYRNAARTVEGLSGEASDVADLTELAGIGKDLAWIPPELREDGGEIEAAEQDALPDLVRIEDIRGDLHVHTDGKAPLEEEARAARDMGYAYMAVTYHSKRVTMANGLDVERLADQIEAVDRLNDKQDGFRVLKGIELDILKDGSLDLPDDILGELDIRVCSVHDHQNLSQKKQTRRILKAMENPYFNISGSNGFCVLIVLFD